MKHLLIIISLLASLTGSGQSGVVRLEFEAAINSDIYEIIPLKATGFLLFYETKDFAGEDSKAWFFSLFKPDFTEAWRANLPVVDQAEYQDYFLQDTMLYLFFLNEGKVKAGTNNFQLIAINLAQGLSLETKGSLPAESSLVRFVIQNGRLIAALNLKNDQAAVYSIDIRTGTVNSFNLAYADQNYIQDLEYDMLRNRIVFTVSNYLARRQNNIYLVVLDQEANFSYDHLISPAIAGKYLNTARIHIADSNHYYLTGTYGGLASKLPSQNEYFGTESAGIFITSLKNDAQEFMNYYNFMEFQNLRAGASARDFYRLQKRKDRESQEYSLNYEILMHDPEPHDSTLVVMMEAFYPEFRTVSDISYDYWGRPVTHTYNVFDGYRFFNSMLASFSMDGKLIWDNSLEINTGTTWRLDKKTAYFFDGEPVLIFYNDGTKIAYRICLDNAELEPYTKMDLETSRTGDKITAVGQNRLVHWYDYNFLAYGYHTIQNNLVTEKNQRTVFYINKIALE